MSIQFLTLFFWSPLALYRPKMQGGPQGYMYLRNSKQIRPLGDLELCLTLDIKMNPCDWVGQKGKWEYNPQTKQLRNPGTGSCLTLAKTSITAVACINGGSKEQEWDLTEFKPQKKMD
jgi:hypothetical protein